MNHRNNELRKQVKKLLTSEEGLKHRSKRPIEPEAVFGQIKYNHKFKRFHFKGEKFVKAEFATVVTVHNIRKMVKNGYGLDSYDITTKKKVTKNYFLVTFFLSS